MNSIQTVLAIAATFAIADAKKTPTAIFHGLGDQCINPGMHNFAMEVADKTGAYAHCVEVGNGSATSIFGNFQHQADMACQAILANENFQGEFNIMGLSQGSLLARYIVESCPISGKVRNYLSIGGPNMGVAEVPECQNGEICQYVNYVARNLVYFKLVQNYLGPAGYFRDPTEMDSYLADSVFLPYLNNEVGDEATKAAVKSRFTALNSAMLVMFSEDTVVYPKESEWFQQLNQDLLTVEAIEDSTFYKEDFIGLRALIEAGKVEYVSIAGDHLQFSESDIDTYFIPFLLK